MRITAFPLLRLEPFSEFEDPNAAPGALRTSELVHRWTLRRAVQNHLAMYVSGLVFMIFGVVAVVNTATSRSALVAGESVIVLLSALYVAAAWTSDSGIGWRWLHIGVFGGVMVGTSALLGLQFTSFGVYFAILLATLIPWRISRVLITLWGLVLVTISVIASDWTPALIGLIGVGIGYAVGSGIEQGRMSQKLRRTELRASQLAVVAERERIARDLHDILGHSLTAVSIKSGLASRLLEVDPVAAKAQMTEVEGIARQALADVRATASGMRQVRLVTEIASARSVLESAGIESATPTAVEPMSDDAAELLGYVVREAVTNVVRHSEAGRCVITVGPDWVSVSDDGRGLGDADPHQLQYGSGLRGLRERVERAGGRLELTATASPAVTGLTVRADLSAASGDDVHAEPGVITVRA